MAQRPPLQPYGRLLFLLSLAVALAGGGAAPAAPQTSGGGASEPLSPENLPARLEEARVGAQNELRDNLDALKNEHGTFWDEVQKAHPGTGGTYDDAQKKAFRDELAKRWSAELEKARAAIRPVLETGRLAILNRASTDDTRVSVLNAALRKHEAEVLEDLKAWIAAEVPKRTAGIDPGEADAKAKAGKILGALADDFASKFAARWAVAVNDVVAKYKAPGAAERANEQAKRVEKLQERAEEDYFQELNKATGFSRIVRCLYAQTEGKPASLVCSPGLLVSAADIGEIVVRGLPTSHSVEVTAVASEDQSAMRPDKVVRKEIEGRDAVAADGTLPPICLMDRAAAEVAAKNLIKRTDPFCDLVTRPAGSSDAVFVSVYKDRRIGPKYGAMFGTQQGARAAFAKLRLPSLAQSDGEVTPLQARARLNLSILVSGGASQILTCVAPQGSAAPSPACASIPVGYQRWSVETGGFLAISGLTDEEIVTQPAEDASKVQVLKMTDGSHYAQETGLWVSFVPRNYPGYGLGLGLVSDSDRPISVYFGGSLRLRTFGHRGLASLNVGVAMRSVDRFDGLGRCLKQRTIGACGQGFALSGAEGDADRVVLLPETSPLLTADEQYHTGLFVAIQLGFSFGPIPGPPTDE